MSIELSFEHKKIGFNLYLRSAYFSNGCISLLPPLHHRSTKNWKTCPRLLVQFLRSLPFPTQELLQEFLLVYESLTTFCRLWKDGAWSEISDFLEHCPNCQLYKNVCPGSKNEFEVSMLWWVHPIVVYYIWYFCLKMR